VDDYDANAEQKLKQYNGENYGADLVM